MHLQGKPGGILYKCRSYFADVAELHCDLFRMNKQYVILILLVQNESARAFSSMRCDLLEEKISKNFLITLGIKNVWSTCPDLILYLCPDFRNQVLIQRPKFETHDQLALLHQRSQYTFEYYWFNAIRQIYARNVGHSLLQLYVNRHLVPHEDSCKEMSFLAE